MLGNSQHRSCATSHDVTAAYLIERTPGVTERNSPAVLVRPNDVLEPEPTTFEADPVGPAAHRVMVIERHGI
jgi:hypothetical protein